MGGSGTSNGGSATNGTDGGTGSTASGRPGGAATGGASAPAYVDNSLNVSGSAFQNFAGLQGLNQNTGVGSLQNASVNVAVSTGTMNIGGPR